ncbi:MAG: MaoC/PaaZ C-terminal domain-containing protein [Deltaproteobacteria bacterium]|nr:MaoC/PaaZ C-terminal domain-containing protein [Deltaproteobacteria bacterium]
MKERFEQELSRQSVTAEEITAAAAVPGGSLWYDGHFPGHPILPGIAILAFVKEAIVTAERTEGREVAITGLRRVRFRLPVDPGDRMEIRIVREQKGGRRSYPFTVALAAEPVCTGIFSARFEEGLPEQTS